MILLPMSGVLDLRHTWLTWMADAGVPVHVLRKIAGHGSLVTTQRYLHPDSQSIAAAGRLERSLDRNDGRLIPKWSQAPARARNRGPAIKS
jgi:integrase